MEKGREFFFQLVKISVLGWFGPDSRQVANGDRFSSHLSVALVGKDRYRFFGGSQIRQGLAVQGAKDHDFPIPGYFLCFHQPVIGYGGQ